MSVGHFGADSVCFESVSAVTATPSVQLGTMRLYAGEYYEYVFAVGDVNKGFGCAYSGTSGHSVLATGIVSGEHCAGFAKHATIPASSYGWLLKKGVLDAPNGRASTVTVVNDLAYLGADGKIVTDVKVVTSAIDHGHIVGKVLSAGASGGTGSSLSLLLVSVF